MVKKIKECKLETVYENLSLFKRHVQIIYIYRALNVNENNIELM